MMAYYFADASGRVYTINYADFQPATSPTSSSRTATDDLTSSPARWAR